MESSETSQVVLVGPTHPYTGGIAQHTTRLALELEAQDIHVSVESWKAQYPKRLYPGPETVPRGQPEIGAASDVTEKLAWYSPISWWNAGRRIRESSVVGFSIPTPFHAVPYLVMLAALGRRPESVGIVHNVLPHEPGPLDRVLMTTLLRRLDRIIVHGDPAVVAARSLGVEESRIDQESLPSPWPANSRRSPSKKRSPGPTRFLFFGTIRKYKGLDLLLAALADVPEVTLTVAGEFWDDKQPYLDQIKALGLESRVTLRPGYVAEQDFEPVFGSHDVLVLPYRSGTGSIVRELAFQHGLPVIATDVGAIAEGIEDGVNGRVVPAENGTKLIQALSQAATPRVLARWRKGVTGHADRQAKLWSRYTRALLGRSEQRAS